MILIGVMTANPTKIVGLITAQVRAMIRENSCKQTV